MLNFIPVLGWLLSLFFAFCIAIPFTLLWNWLAPIYAYWLPELYLQLPFFHVVGLFMLLPMVRILVVPRFFVTNLAELVKSKKKKEAV